MAIPSRNAAIKVKGSRGYQRPGKMPRVKAEELEGPVEEIGEINGIQAKSRWEYNIALALWTLGWEFDYQVPINSGSRLRGGQVIDFLVDTVPTKTVIRVQGDYWHQDSQLEQLKATQIQQALGMTVRILDAEKNAAETYECAYGFILQNLGRA